MKMDRRFDLIYLLYIYNYSFLFVGERDFAIAMRLMYNNASEMKPVHVYYY